MVFETKRLILRPWQDSDAESLYKYAKNPNVGPSAGWSCHTSVENSREIIENVLSEEGCYAVVLKETNEPIGSVGIEIGKRVEWKQTEAELGCWIAEEYWGRGLIPEALSALAEYGFAELGLSALWYGYYQGNEKSKRVQQKLGFTYSHQAEITNNATGEQTTIIFNKLIREDYFSRKEQ